ncbi:unnamed protein product, partial [Rotaria sp. Silwood2]
NDDNHVYLIIQSINTENVNDEPIQTPTQLVDLYQKTLESATQGKISIKNTFSIPLFERLSQVLNVVALNDKDNHNIGPNFVKAGLVIDPSTMYSSSDYPLIDVFKNANSQPDDEQIKINNVLNHTITKMIDLASLREFSFINTIHESCLTQVDENIDRSYTNNGNPLHTNKIFKNVLNELSNQDLSNMHSNLGNYQLQQSAKIFQFEKINH